MRVVLRVLLGLVFATVVLLPLQQANAQLFGGEKTSKRTLTEFIPQTAAAAAVIFPKRLAEDPKFCLLYTSPSPRDQRGSRMPSSA